LSLDEIDRIAASLDRVLWVAFTGGEPFLRKDLPEFAGILHDRLRPVTLSINTNGIQTDKIVAATEQLLARCPDTFVGILCSLDGLQPTHDRIRGVPRNFERTIETFRALKKLRDHAPNLGVGITTTFCSWNQDEMDDMFELVVRDLKPDNWDLSFVRGQAMEPALELADVAKYRRIKSRLEQAYASGDLRYYSNMPLARFVHAKERLSTRTVLKTLETGSFQTPCYAGALSAVISEEGDVYPCELLNRKIGNLRDAGYNFKALWAADNARDTRTFVRESKCFCTHECNMSINLLFNPAAYPRIVAEMALEAAGNSLSSRPKSLPGLVPAPLAPQARATLTREADIRAPVRSPASRKS